MRALKALCSPARSPATPRDRPRDLVLVPQGDGVVPQAHGGLKVGDAQDGAGGSGGGGVLRQRPELQVGGGGGGGARRQEDMEGDRIVEIDRHLHRAHTGLRVVLATAHAGPATSP